MAEHKHYYLPAEGQLVEVTKDVYTEYYKFQRKETYQIEKDQENGVMSYNALDNGETVGEALFADPNTDSPESKLIANENLNLLKTSINTLSEDEQALIHAIYYEEKTEQMCATDIGLSKSGVRYRHKKILKKLRKKMNFL